MLLLSYISLRPLKTPSGDQYTQIFAGCNTLNFLNLKSP